MTLHEAIEKLADDCDAEARDAEYGARCAAETNNGTALRMYNSEKYTYERTARLLRAALAANPAPGIEWGVTEHPTMRVAGEMDSTIRPVRSESKARFLVDNNPRIYAGLVKRTAPGPWERAE